MTVVSIKGNLVVQQRYVCGTCGATGVGDPVRISVYGPDAWSVHDAIDRIRPDPNKMPVGWCSYSGGVKFQCPKCKPKV